MPIKFDFKFLLLVLLAISTAVGLQFEVTKKRNASAYEVPQMEATAMNAHFLFRIIRKPQEPVDNSANDFRKMFTQILDVSWNNSDFLMEMAETSSSLNVKATIFETLHNALKQTKKIYNPFELIRLYSVVEATVAAFCGIESNTKHCSRITDTLSQLRDALSARSAQMLQTLAILPCCYCKNSTILQGLLNKLTTLEDEIYVETVDQIYDGVQDLIPLEQLARLTSNFSVNTKQNVIAILQLLARLPATNNSHGEARSVLVGSLSGLVNQADFGKLEPHWRANAYTFLSSSMSNLYVATKVCIRNATNATRFLYECPETYLMCTNDKDLQQAAYVVEHNVNAGGIAFRSLYWSDRYISLKGNTTLSERISSSADFIKNVYSSLSAQYWQVIPRGDNVALFNYSLRSYLCAGDKMPGDNEGHVYTRRADDFHSFQRECEWFIEDCSEV